jgi:hypothetical protein
MRKSLALLALGGALTLTVGPVAQAAAPSGSYKGRIAHQGYEITFKVKNGRMTKVVARLLQDCDRDGSSEQMTLAPNGSWRIKNGRVKAKTTDKYDQAAAHYELDVRFTGKTARGWIREYDTVEGSGIVCDTLKRKFTARRG